MEQKNKKDFLPILLYIIIFFGIQLLFGIYLGFTQEIGNTLSDKTLSIINIVSYFAIFLTLIIIYYNKLIQDIKRINKKDITYIVISAVVLIVLNFIISNLFVSLNVEMENQDTVVNLLNN